jgi:hypothetical protein
LTRKELMEMFKWKFMYLFPRNMRRLKLI